jgi:RNA polymerase sigma factor (sigma-70 family)
MRRDGTAFPQGGAGTFPEGGAGTTDMTAATACYAEHQDMLFALVYNVLGTVTDTEDVLQETWLSWAAKPHVLAANPRAYLLRVAVNQAVARLRSLRRSREHYVGPWLPEPLVTSDDAAAGSALRNEAVSLALLVVLETLTPLERAVFVLREAFGYDYGEIAAILRRSQATIRQLAHRARGHVQSRSPRYKPDPAVHRIATERFIAAAAGGDLSTLMQVLAPDVALWTDGGGVVQAARRVVVGREKVARLIAAQSAAMPRDVVIRYLEVNGDPAALACAAGSAYGVLVTELGTATDRISGLYAVLNPEKLGGVASAAV